MFRCSSCVQFMCLVLVLTSTLNTRIRAASLVAPQALNGDLLGDKTAVIDYIQQSIENRKGDSETETDQTADFVGSRNDSSVKNLPAKIQQHYLVKPIVDPPSDMRKPLHKICLENGYHVVQHRILTEDGYYLTLHRIPGRLSERLDQAMVHKPPVLFQHGILDSANCWVINDVEKAPAFMAVEAGFDVWLGNLRGNLYSNEHVSLDPQRDAAKFYDYSLHEHANQDLHAMISYITQVSQYEKLAYVGHSMGTTIFFHLATEDPSFIEDHVSSFIGIGPIIVPTQHHCFLLSMVAPFHQPLYLAAKLLNYHAILQPTLILRFAAELFCGSFELLCIVASYFVATDHFVHTTVDRFQVYMGHFPSGVSTKVLFHYLQNIRQGEATRDFKFYNKRRNRKAYQSDSPETISFESLQRLAVPTSLFVGKDDPLSTVEDDRRIKDLLGETTLHYYEEIEADHFSFLIGKDMSYFQTTVLNILNEQVSLKKNLPSLDDDDDSQEEALPSIEDIWWSV